jgi:2,4'-dihydroxyacetophenone dioxygenase
VGTVSDREYELINEAVPVIEQIGVKEASHEASCHKASYCAVQRSELSMASFLQTLRYAVGEMAIKAIPADERVWVPQGTNVWFRPLLLNRVNGEWVNLIRVRRAGQISRHAHPAPVHGYVIKGSWRYLEHDWTAHAGMYVFEPPGDIHTLVVDSADEMITLFHVSGALIFYEGETPIGHDDVHVKIERCSRHYEEVGLGADFVEQFIR